MKVQIQLVPYYDEAKEYKTYEVDLSKIPMYLEHNGTIYMQHGIHLGVNIIRVRYEELRGERLKLGEDDRL